MVVMDYFSRYPEVVKLKSTISNSVINALKGGRTPEVQTPPLTSTLN